MIQRLYEKIGDIYADTDLEKAKEYVLKMGNLSEQLNWNRGRYVYATDYATILYRMGLSDTAIIVLQKALELAERENNEPWTANLKTNIGNAYKMKNWIETALSYYMEALSIYEKSVSARSFFLTVGSDWRL